jgi:NAD(P)-dependent dehydrogenase (short-subunit alcohol dehydrogenase family)
VEDLDVALNGCVRSTFIVCKEAIPELIKTKGAIVNMSSVSGIRAVSTI